MPYSGLLGIELAPSWLDELRDAHGKWTLSSHPASLERHGYQGKFMGYDPNVPSMEPADLRKPLDQPGDPNGSGHPNDPIDVHGDMTRAVQLMADGKHVRLNSPSEIKPLLDEVNRQADAQGYTREHEPSWDLGNVSVKGTRLFNEQTIGIPRTDMPQLNGPARPGSEAALLAGGANKFIELDPEFRAQLRHDGISVKNERVPAGNLRATQTQLTAATVAGITRAAEQGNPKVRKMLKEPIWVTSDNYVIDGHHRWASDEALAFAGLGPKEIEVQRIGLPARLAIPYALEFTQRMGIGGRAIGNTQLVEGANALLGIELAFHPDELRDKGGRWYHGTSDQLSPGQVIDPSVPHRANFSPEYSEPKSVYISRQTRHAKHYADRDRGGLGDPHVYEVEPLGPTWPIATGSDQHQTKSPIRIIREVGSASMSNLLGVSVIELRFDPLELRDRHGRWTKNASSFDTSKHNFQVGDSIRNTRNGRTGRIISRNAPIDGHVYAVQVQYDEDGKRPRTQSIVTEKLEPHIRNEQMSFHKLLRAAADPLVGPPIPNEEALNKAVVAETEPASRIIPKLLGGDHEEWNGKVSIFRKETKDHILAEMDWNGTLDIADNVAAAVKDAYDHPNDPVHYPDAFEVLAHEMIHGVVPPGTAAANKAAYQNWAVSQIEEGFTELGAIHHAPEFMVMMGIADREALIYPGHTVKELADTINDPEQIRKGNAWGHYPGQTKDAQDWVEQVAQEEKIDTKGPTGQARIRELADEINRQGASGKVGAMSHQLARAMTADEPKMRSDPAFMAKMEETIFQSIMEQWNTDNPNGAAKQAYGTARAMAARLVQQEREMAERAA